MNSRSRTDGNSHGRADEFFGAPVILGVSSKHDVYAAYTAVQHDYYSPSSVITHISPKQVLKPRLSISLRKIVARDHKLIGAPLPLCSNHVLDLSQRINPEKFPNYHVSLEFSVDGYGEVYDVSVGDENVPSKLQKYVKEILYVTKFRPRMVDGDTVTTEHINLRQTFPTNPQIAASTLDLHADTVYQGSLEGAVAQI